MNHYICVSCGALSLGWAKSTICQKCGGLLKSVSREEYLIEEKGLTI